MTAFESTIRRIVFGVLLTLFSTQLALAEDGDTSNRRFRGTIGVGVDFSRGDFGENITTNVGSVPVFTKLEWEPFTFRLSIPFVVIDGSDLLRGGTDGVQVDDENAAAGSRTDYGLGDLVTGLTYTYYPSSKRTFVPVIDLTTRVKIPTATNGLGTGKTDVTLQVEFSKVIGRFSPFVGTGYRFRGGSAYDDSWLFFAGSGFKISRAVSIGVAYDFREAATDRASDASEISPFMTFRLGDHVRWTPYGVIGLSDGSPDWGVGSTISVGF